MKRRPPNTGALDGVLPSFRPEDTNSEFNQMVYLVQAMIAGINVATVVKVVAVHGAAEGINPLDVGGPGLVDVLPLVNIQDASGKSWPHTTLFNLPYLRLQGGNTAVVADPQVGDIGIAVFCDRDISGTKAKKGAAVPASQRRFSYSDGFYIGGWSHRVDGPDTYLVMLPGGQAALRAPGGGFLTAADWEVSDGDLNLAAGVLKVAGTQVIGPQQAAIPNPVGSSTSTDNNPTIIAMLTAMRNHGMIA